MKLLPIILSVFLLAACATTEPFTVEPYVSEDNELLVDRGRYALLAVNGEVAVTVLCEPGSDTSRLTMYMAVENRTGSRYLFEDSQIEVLAGDRDTESWRSLGRWDADRFYSEAAEEARQRQNQASALGAMAIVASGTRRPGPGPYHYPVSDVLVTSLVVSNELDEVARSNDDYLSMLENHLLFTSHIAAGETYAGVFYIYPDWSQPDCKLVYHCKDGSELSFIYSRSDRGTMKR